MDNLEELMVEYIRMDRYVDMLKEAEAKEDIVMALRTMLWVIHDVDDDTASKLIETFLEPFKGGETNAEDKKTDKMGDPVPDIWSSKNRRTDSDNAPEH